MVEWFSVELIWFYKFLDDVKFCLVFFCLMCLELIIVWDKVVVKLLFLYEIYWVLDELVEFFIVDILDFVFGLDYWIFFFEKIEILVVWFWGYWGLGDDFIVDLMVVFENVGVVIVEIFLDLNKLDGVLMWFVDVFVIFFVKDKDGGVRCWFDVVYEFGYLVLYWSLI